MAKQFTFIFLGLAIAFAVAITQAEKVVVTQTAVNIATSSTQAIAAASVGVQRKLLILINDSDTTIYCNIAGGTAVANEGVRLNASGGNIVMDVAITFSAVNCIHGGTGSKVLLVAEGV